MRVVSAAEIDAVLEPAALADALADAFAGEVVAPPRQHLHVERHGSEPVLLIMTAWTGADVSPSFMVTKMVSVFPANGAKGLPSVNGTVWLADGATGVPLAVLDGTRLTLWRTAAASALAARHLARPDAARMVMVGCGALAPFMIRAHRAQRQLTDIALWNHRPEKARELAASLAGEGLPARAVDDLGAAVRGADIVSCATLSQEPLVHGAWLKPGAHLDCVGAFRPTMRETDDDCVRRASLFCDIRQSAAAEGGDYAIPLASGVIAPSAIRADLFDLVAGRHPGRTSPDEITMFKSVGASLEDLAAATHVWSRVAPPPGA
jgi:ornithine cyclodeaminase